MKREPPPYPRPVPNIDFDEDPILPGTIIYTNEDEIQEPERVAKRRRVEANANAYLRGEGLFILSASLQGPFDAGWKNPWAPTNRKRNLKVDDGPRPIKRARVSPQNVGPVQAVGTNPPVNRSRPSLPPQENPFARTIRSSEPPTHDEKVESWLRRNNALPHDSFAVPTSPTPKKRPSVAGSSKVSKPAWTPTKQRITVSSQDIRAPSHHITSRVPDSFETVIPPGRVPAETHDKLQDALQTQDAPHVDLDEDGQAVFIDHVEEQPVRAEQAILNLKRRSEEPPQKTGTSTAVFRSSGQSKSREDETVDQPPTGVTKSVDATGDQSEPVPALPVSIPQTMLKNDAMGNSIVEPILISHHAPQDQRSDGIEDGEKDAHRQGTEHHIRNGIDVPLCSAAVSEVQSVRMPPSAQHKPELHTATSNMSSAALLPDVLNDKRTATLVTAQSNLSEQVTNDDQDFRTQQQAQHQVKTEEPQQGVVAKESGAPPSREQSPLPQEKAISPRMTSRSPFRASNGKLSQTSLDGSIVTPSAAGHKARPGKTTKKASFAEASFNSSHGSIKSVLKVQKMDTMDRAQRHTPPALSFSKPVGVDLPLEAGGKSPTQNSTTRKMPKSILRSRSTHSSPAAALASAMLSPRQREGSSLSKVSNRDPSGQNGIVQRQQADEFDMEGALDDLGSFLSTWDAEKEGLRAM